MYFVDSKDKYNSGYYLKDTSDGVVEFYNNDQVMEMRDRGIDIKGFYRCGVHPVVPVGANSYCYVGEYWGDGHYDGYLYSISDSKHEVSIKESPIRLFIPEDPLQSNTKILRYSGYVYDICGDSKFLLAVDGFEHMESVRAKFIGSFTPSIPLRCFFHSRRIQRLLNNSSDVYSAVMHERPEEARRVIYMNSKDYLSAIVSEKLTMKEKVVFLEDKGFYSDSFAFINLFSLIREDLETIYNWDIFDYHDFDWDTLRSESPEIYAFCRLVEGIYVPATMCYGNDKEYCNILPREDGAVIQSLEVSEQRKKVLLKREKLVDLHRNGEWGKFVVSNPSIAVIHLLYETRAVYEEPLLEDNGYESNDRVKAKRRISGSGDCELMANGDLVRCKMSQSGIFDIPEGTKRICTGSLIIDENELKTLKGFIFPKSLEVIDDAPIKAHGLYGTFSLDCSQWFICWKSSKKGLFSKFIDRLESHKHDLYISLYRQRRSRPDFLKLKLANRVEVIGGLLGTETGEALLGIGGVWRYGDRDVFNEFISQLSAVDGTVLVKELESCFRLYIKTPKLDSGRFNIPKTVIRATLGKSVTDKYGYSVPDLPSYADFIDLRHSIVFSEYIKFSHFKEIYDGIKSYLPVNEVAVLDSLVSDKWFSFSQYRLNYTNWLKSIGVYDSYLDGFDKQKFIRLYRSGKFE